MEYFKFLEQLIEDGIADARVSYVGKNHLNELEGALAGFNVCRNKYPRELLNLHKEVQPYINNSFEYKDHPEYWWLRCYQFEIEYVINVVSAVLVNQGVAPLLPDLPNERGYMKAVLILNQFR